MADRNAWRGESKATAPTAAGVSRPTAGAVQPRGKRLFILAASCLGLVGIIAALFVLLRPPPSPYFVPICITEYKSRHYPVNFLANQDREALLRADGPFSNTSANAFSSQEKQLLIQELKHLASRSEPVVIYLSAFMMADAAGELVLLPADANPDQPGTWLRFNDVLKDLQACPSKHKVLIIDAMRPIADPHGRARQRPDRTSQSGPRPGSRSEPLHHLLLFAGADGGGLGADAAIGLWLLCG